MTPDEMRATLVLLDAQAMRSEFGYAIFIGRHQINIGLDWDIKLSHHNRISDMLVGMLVNHGVRYGGWVDIVDLPDSIVASGYGYIEANNLWDRYDQR